MAMGISLHAGLWLIASSSLQVAASEMLIAESSQLISKAGRVSHRHESRLGSSCVEAIRVADEEEAIGGKEPFHGRQHEHPRRGIEVDQQIAAKNHVVTGRPREQMRVECASLLKVNRFTNRGIKLEALGMRAKMALPKIQVTAPECVG